MAAIGLGFVGVVGLGTDRLAAWSPGPEGSPEVGEALADFGSARVAAAGEARGGERLSLALESWDYSLVPMPAGRFEMGSPEGEEGREDDETLHEVLITRPFWMGVTEVTQGLYEEVMCANRSHFAGADRPVENVNWCDAVVFANRLSDREGLTAVYAFPEGFEAGMEPDVCDTLASEVTWDRQADGYRLPTEAEWEHATRAGTRTPWWTGDNEADLTRVAWYDENDGKQTHAVATRGPPNPWGLHDVYGNVWEWVWDAYAPYSTENAEDPAVSDGLGRVGRGGGYGSVPRGMRSANRLGLDPGPRFRFVGLRLARTRRFGAREE